jgi:hypothetical protein
MSYDSALHGEIELPAYIQRTCNSEDLCEKVFPAAAMAGIRPESDFFASRVILAVRNVDLGVFNTTLLGKLPGDARPFYSVDSADTDDVDEGREEITREFLQQTDLPGLPSSTPS